MRCHTQEIMASQFDMTKPQLCNCEIDLQCTNTYISQNLYFLIVHVHVLITLGIVSTTL